MADQKAKPAQSGKKIKVTLVKGITATKHKHRETVRGLGLRHREHTVELVDTPAIRGMINRVSYLVKVEE
jgi:large subunit ribosomal protein L30